MRLTCAILSYSDVSHEDPITMCDMWLYIISILLQNRRSKSTSKEADVNDTDKVLVDSLTEGSDLLMLLTLVSLVFYYFCLLVVCI